MQIHCLAFRKLNCVLVIWLLLAAAALSPSVARAQPEVQIEFIRSFGMLGAAPGQFNSIAGVTVDNAGYIYITDNDNHRIQICSYLGNCVADGGIGTAPGQFQFPIGIALDQTGRIVVSDGRNFRIQIRDLQGVWNTFGSNGMNVGQFRIPGGVIVDAENQIYIADENNGRVQVCDDQGRCTVVADGFVTPRSVGFDSMGSLVISDRETNRIHNCIPKGPCSDFGSTGTTPGRFRAPTELWVDEDDRIFITDRDNDRFQVCDLGGACLAFGQRGTGPGQFNSPTSVAVDTQDRIIIGDSGNNRIQIFQAIYPPSNEPMSYTIGGTVSGLAGAGLVLQNNGGDDLAIAANGGFTFATALSDGSEYAVSVLSQPGDPAQTCSVGNGGGTLAGADVTDVTVVCSTETFTVGGTVSGLAGAGLVLQNNGGDDLAIAANGGFTFATALPDGSEYAVSVLSQPGDPAQTCSVGNGSGTLSSANVTNVSVICLLESEFRINVGLNDAWYNPATNGQGFFIIVFPDISVVFMAWFTYDVARPPDDIEAILGESGHRWITAQGPYEGNTAMLDVVVTRGGVFDSGDPVPENSHEGTIELVFDSCTQGVVRYDLPALGLMGEVPIQRITPDKVPLCESLAE